MREEDKYKLPVGRSMEKKLLVCQFSPVLCSVPGIHGVEEDRAEVLKMFKGLFNVTRASNASALRDTLSAVYSDRFPCNNKNQLRQ